MTASTVSLVSYLASQKDYVKGSGIACLSEGLLQAGVKRSVVAAGGDAVGQLGYGATAPSGTDYTAAIQSVISATNGLLIWDGAWGVTGLTLPSNIWILCPSGAYGAILRNSAKRAMFMNAGQVNAGGDASAHQQNTWGAEISGNAKYRSVGPYANANIRLTGGMWNGNSPNNQGDANSGMSSTYGTISFAQMYGVTGLIIEGCTTMSFSGYSMTGCNLFGAIFRDNTIDQSQVIANFVDGIHINGPASQIRILNNKIHTFDDHVALNADDATGAVITTWYPIAGDITDVRIDDLTVWPGADGQNDACLIRMLSSASVIDDVVVSRASGNVWTTGVRIGNDPVGTNYYNNGSGNFGNITFEDCSFHMLGGGVGFAIDGGVWGKLKILRRNLVNVTPAPNNAPDVVVQSTSGGTVDSLLYNYNAVLTSGATDVGQTRVQIAGPVSNLYIEADDWRDSSFTANAAASVCHITSGGNVNRLKFSGMAERVSYVIGADTGVTLHTVIAEGLHSNSNSGYPLKLGTVTVKNSMHNAFYQAGAFSNGGTVTNDSATPASYAD